MNGESENRKVVLTCAQPTGKLHLGNYLGAVKNWVEMSEKYECYFGVVDMHAITIPYVPADLKKNVYECTAQYMACGLDPEKCNLFLQSSIVGHAELAWILGCICPLGQLERMTQYKDKASKHKENLNSGLLYYPVLMASDILIYNADVVPVGEDQKQHIELTRDLAQKFNSRYSDTFKIPEPYIPQAGARIMSLQTPTSKMSKSDPNQNGTLYITDDPAVLRKKIMSAVTDSDSEVRYDIENKAGVSNLMSIMSALSGKSFDDIETEFKGKGYGDFKKAVADVVIDALAPVREKFLEISADKKRIESALAKGNQAAQRRVNRLMSKVYRKVGFMRFE
ncbi:MAG: tryptophan--tRNA ligase, partial [Opitutales bacterium]|nr:tryptophan--tRNA ligase [Opitutales bacterium]